MKGYTVRVDFDVEAASAAAAQELVHSALHDLPAPLDVPLLPLDVYDETGEQVIGYGYNSEEALA
jgi:hypothetical protein